MITLCEVCHQYHESVTACPNQDLGWHSKQGNQWKPLSQDDVMYWKIRAEQAESDLLSARQTIADLTAERNAWREDADSVVKKGGHTAFCGEYLTQSTIWCTCGWTAALAHHRQLHERYPVTVTQKG